VIILLSVPALTRGEEDAANLLQTRNVYVATAMFQGKSFLGNQSFQGTAPAYVKDYYVPQPFLTRDFSTGSFQTKGFRTGDFKFATGPANTSGRYLIPNAGKNVDTKTVDAKDARESGKNYDTRDYVTRDYRVRGKSQDIFDNRENATHKSMTIEEVRELLNKNK
jgi:hypothetical protein